MGHLHHIIKRIAGGIQAEQMKRDCGTIGSAFGSARESGEDIQCFDGEARARIYTLAYMTGLRRSEIGSLTKESFDLESSPPTVTVQAAFSRHRRRDVIPLHPELVALLKDWLDEYAAGEFLFPKLGKRRTWLMVKKDLGRVGIAYVTAEGIADFHAAGRHSHITELLRNGASLPEAKELARHSDIRMTMKYTHIGIHDQATAIKQLPWAPKESQKHGEPVNAEATPRECTGSDSDVSGVPLESSAGTECHKDSHEAPVAKSVLASPLRQRWA